MAVHLKGVVQDLGDSLINLVQTASDIQKHTYNSSAKQKLVNQAREVSSKVTVSCYEL